MCVCVCVSPDSWASNDGLFGCLLLNCSLWSIDLAGGGWSADNGCCAQMDRKPVRYSFWYIKTHFS